MFLQKKINIILFFLVSIILTACSTSDDYLSQNDTTTNTIEQDYTIDNDGSLVFSIRQPVTLNPLINEDKTVDAMLSLVFEGLFEIDDSLKPVPNLASSYFISEDGLQITINMRTDIYWHDGTSIKATDVIYSLDTIKENPNSIYYNSLDYIESYSSNGNTINIYYKEPFSFALYNLCFPIIPKHYYSKISGEDSTENLNTIGSGMFKFSEYNIAKEVILKSTSNFKGSPKISTIKAVITTDRETDLYAFEQDITNFITVSISELGKFYSNKEIEYENLISNNFEFLGFNLKNELISNINLRKAIAYAIPKDEIISSVYLENGVLADTIVNPNSWLFSENVETYNYNLEEAKEYLQKSGVVFSENEKITILVNEENSERLETAKIIASRLNNLGINTEVIKKPFEEYKSLIEGDNFDIFIGGIDFDKTPDYKSFLTSTGSINYTNIQDEYMDELVNKVYSATNEEDFINYMEELQNYCNEYLGFIGIIFKDNVLLSNQNIKTVKGSVYNYFSNIKDWYITN